ncbi:MAG: tetratricopeptide repeat protein, partial [Planctomycetota bacterium]
KGKLSDAAELFNHTLDLNPKDTRALRDSAVVYLAMDKPDQALKQIEKALAISNETPELKAIKQKIRVKQAAQIAKNLYNKVIS